MAKELPYFKFECNQWDSGNIQMCSMEAQGLFVNICSLYWSRLGELPVKLAKQKLCNSYASAYNELIDEDIIQDVDGKIIIEFLDEQLNEFNDVSEKRRNAANKRWKNASALQVDSKSNAIRRDKKKEEDIKGDGLTPTQKVLDFVESDYNENLVAGFKRFTEFIEKTKHVKNIPSQINITSYQKICDEHTVDKLKQKIGELDNWLDDPNIDKGKKKKKSLPHLMNNTWLKNGY